VTLDNGIVHKVGAVIIPDTLASSLPSKTLVGTAQDTATLSTLVTLVNGASDAVVNALTTGSVTLFAPTDEAFGRLEPAAATYLGLPAN